MHVPPLSPRHHEPVSWTLPARPPKPGHNAAGRQRLLVRCGVLTLLVLVYWASFSVLYARMGGAAFLPGLGVCLVAAGWLGRKTGRGFYNYEVKPEVKPEEGGK